MKLISYRTPSGVRLAIDSGEGLLDVARTAEAADVPAPTTMEDLLARGAEGLRQLQRLSREKPSFLPEDQLTYAPCVTKPEKIICVGLNYISHDKECSVQLPTEPVLFGKYPNALAAHGECIPLSPIARQYDYEAELVIVMGKEARNVPESEALSYVLGYTIGNDLSARDLQFRSGQWLLGKNLNHFAPVGPCIVTGDAIDPDDLDLCCKRNGQVCQQANTREMIFSCGEIISYISRYMPLMPGDLIFTGTPGGVILGQRDEERCWLKAGDRIEISIEGIGTLVNTFRQGGDDR